jgi:hypothetical protein
MDNWVNPIYEARTTGQILPRQEQHSGTSEKVTPRSKVGRRKIQEVYSMKWLILFFFWLGWMACSLTAATEISLSPPHSVVQIQAFPTQNKVFLGSGVVIGPQQVATNCHVTRHTRTIFIIKGALHCLVQSQQADIQKDLCLLSTSSLPFPPTRLGRTIRLRIGQALHLYGYPRAMGMALSPEGMAFWENSASLPNFLRFPEKYFNSHPPPSAR